MNIISIGSNQYRVTYLNLSAQRRTVIAHGLTEVKKCVDHNFSQRGQHLYRAADGCPICRKEDGR